MKKLSKEKIFVSTFSSNALEAIKKYGLGMEINHTCISEDLDDNVEKREQLLFNIRNDMQISGSDRMILHGPFTEIHPAAIDYRAKQLASRRLNEAFQVSHSLGINRMVVHSGWLPFIYFKEWQVEKSILFWEEFMADKPSDFNIYIENVLEDEPLMLLDMMKGFRDPRIGLCLDIGHANAMTCPEYSVEDWICVLSPYIRHFHIHNNHGTEDSHLPLQTGSMNMTNIFRIISDYCKDDVTYTIEAREAIPCIEWLIEKQLL